MAFTPLSEVAETVVDGLLCDRFWMVEEGALSRTWSAERTDIILQRDYPNYQFH